MEKKEYKDPLEGFTQEDMLYFLTIDKVWGTCECGKSFKRFSKLEDGRRFVNKMCYECKQAKGSGW